MFDPAEYENMVIEGAHDTKHTAIPSDDYNALIQGVKLEKVETKRGDSLVLRVNWLLFDASDELKAKLNRQEIVVRQDIWIDLTPSGSIAFGPNQNVRLGLLRDAVGLNDPRKKFNFKMLEGQGPVQIHVEGDPETGYSNVTRIGAKKGEGK